MTLDRDAFCETLANATDALLAERTAEGCWQGELSSSALSTATALGALASVDAAVHADLINNAARWLIEHANDDDGWGDTPESPSNLSTTLLAWTALSLVPDRDGVHSARRDAEAWLRDAVGTEHLTPARIAAAVRQAYGRDHTFAAPILAFCAIINPLAEGHAGPVGEIWKYVPPLPFELAVLPHRLLRLLRADVVSYALPALIAIGQVTHHHKPTWALGRRWLRHLLRKPTLRKLRRIQPASGGYLEAAPLSSFVAISLAAIGRHDDPVVINAVRFLRETVRPDGSWPIDTDLATWVTTLAVNALCDSKADDDATDSHTRGNANSPTRGATDMSSYPCLSREDASALHTWLSAQQHCVRHPYTQAEPGGWAWTNRSGGVPDVDDTAGAIRAMLSLGEAPMQESIRMAVDWLLGLQNRDGGWPTFCRGWGKLPFDQSCPDLTAHALQALGQASAAQDEPARARIDRAIERGLAYLHAAQRPDGAWVPLWFGNQLSPTKVNPVFGTARVLSGLAGLTHGMSGEAGVMAAAGLGWLLSVRDASGAWGGDDALPPSIEETAAAVEALGRLHGTGFCDDSIADELAPAVTWLIERTERGGRFPPSPIGLYFAQLWYHEKLYPLIFTVAALRSVRQLFR